MIRASRRWSNENSSARIALVRGQSGRGRVPSGPKTHDRKPPSPQGSWFKGNLHTHTLNSDGDSTPDDVVRWYREHGYNFVTLTDHNYLTSVDGLNALHGADDKFLVMKGEEVTDRFEDKPVHVNGFAPNAFIKPTGGSSVLDMAQRMIDAIRGAGAVPSVNHPEFRLGDLRGRTRCSSSARDCSRCSTAIRPSTTWAAAACPGSKRCGIACSRAARCSTASPWTMRITSSGRRTRRCRGLGRVGCTCDRLGSNRARSSRRSSAAISIRPPASSCSRSRPRLRR